jgi:hypothetical protein
MQKISFRADLELALRSIETDWSNRYERDLDELNILKDKESIYLNEISQLKEQMSFFPNETQCLDQTQALEQQFMNSKDQQQIILSPLQACFADDTFHSELHGDSIDTDNNNSPNSINQSSEASPCTTNQTDSPSINYKNSYYQLLESLENQTYPLLAELKQVIRRLI